MSDEDLTRRRGAAETGKGDSDRHFTLQILGRSGEQETAAELGT